MTTAQNLLVSGKSAEAIARELFRLKKADRAGYSLAVLARSAGIPSKGYLSEVLRGKRKIPYAYAEDLGRALGFTGLEREYFTQLVRVQNERNPLRKAALKDYLLQIRRSLTIETVAPDSRVADFPFAFEVFCAFGLFRCKPTLPQLVAYFGPARRPDVEQALELLQNEYYIAPSGKHYVLLKNHVFFGRGHEKSHLNLLRHGLTEAQRAAETYYAKSESAHFESAVLSVRRQDYVDFLQRLRADIQRWKGSLESEEADTLIRINAQIFPIEKAGKVS